MGTKSNPTSLLKDPDLDTVGNSFFRAALPIKAETVSNQLIINPKKISVPVPYPTE
jgi:hypothetical protein